MKLVPVNKVNAAYSIKNAYKAQGSQRCVGGVRHHTRILIDGAEMFGDDGSAPWSVSENLGERKSQKKKIKNRLNGTKRFSFQLSSH